KASRIRHPAEVFLFCDGKRGNEPALAYAVFDDRDDQSLYDWWRGRGSPNDSEKNWAELDESRHRRRINEAFVDGHAETIDAPDSGNTGSPCGRADLERIGVSKGVYR